MSNRWKYWLFFAPFLSFSIYYVGVLALRTQEVPYEIVTGVSPMVVIPTEYLPLRAAALLDQKLVVPGQTLLLSTTGHRPEEIAFLAGELKRFLGPRGFRITTEEEVLSVTVPNQPSLQSRHRFLVHVWHDPLSLESQIEVGLLRILE